MLGLSFPPSRLLGRRCWISSAPQFVGFIVPTIQTRAKSHWETVGFSREVRFSLPVSAPRRLRWGCLSFSAALTMKVFSTFLGLLVAPDADVSVGRTGLLGGPSRSFLCQPGYPEYRSMSLLKTFAVALVLKARSWRKHIAFLFIYVRVPFCRSLKTFHLGFCGAGF